MRKSPDNLGRETVHAMALHDKVWNTFSDLKQEKGITADRLLSELLISYTNDKHQFEHHLLQDTLKTLKHNVVKQFDIQKIKSSK